MSARSLWNRDKKRCKNQDLILKPKRVVTGYACHTCPNISDCGLTLASCGEPTRKGQCNRCRGMFTFRCVGDAPFVYCDECKRKIETVK